MHLWSPDRFFVFMSTYERKTTYTNLLGTITSNVAVKVANIILDAFISWNAAKPLRDATVLLLATVNA